MKRSNYTDLIDFPPDSSPGLHLGGTPPRAPNQAPTPESRAAADAEFHSVFYSGVWHFVDRYFHTKVAGASYPNADGTSRIAAIKQCRPSELLVVEWEKGNRYHCHARAVKRQDGQQLGYLPYQVSDEIHDDFFVSGVTWLGIFQCTNHHPETGRVVGANILLVRKTPDRAAKPEVKIAKYKGEIS